MRCREMAPARLRGAMNILFQVAGCTIAAAGLLERARHLVQFGAAFAHLDTQHSQHAADISALKRRFLLPLQLMVTIGILVSQLINYGTERFFWGWRVSLGIAVVPALILFIGVLLPLATECPCPVQA
jgi:MFS transporter, SP family, sugar:H+ symporter